MQLIGRLLGVVLLASAFVPFHRLLDPGLTGPAGASTRGVAENAWVLGLTGTLIVLVFSWVVVRMSGPTEPTGPLRAMESLERVPGPVYAGIVGLAAVVLTTAVAWFVHGAAPTSVDEMVQLAHANALAAGRLGLATEGDAAAWLLQNGLATDSGWVSIYPPLHTVLLAMGRAIGAPWLVGPASVGAATAASVFAVDRLAGPSPARVLGLLLLVSPFWLLLGGSHLSHTTAAAGVALTLFFAVRALDGGTVWAVATGAGMGVAVSARPWVGLVSALILVAAVWGPWYDRKWRSRLGRRSIALVAGGAPFAALLLLWNNHLFGSPLRLGYSAAFGPSHGLGFRTDPWGNRYGPLESLAYSGADLTQLGVRLLESPVPILAVIGFAALRRTLPPAARVLAAWVIAAVAANAIYWHHGVHFGPRMLFESTPGWMALFAIVFAGAFAAGPPTTERRVVRWTLGIAVAGGMAFTPFVFSSATRAAPFDLPSAANGEVVFVHGSWSSRIASRLAATGVTRDSIETLLRRNDICAVDTFSRARAADPQARPLGLDVEPRPGSPSNLESRLLSPGNGVRVDPSIPPIPACVREARSDRLGVRELETVAWRVSADPDAPVRYARDLGPAANLAVLEALGRPARLLVDTGDASGPLLLDYAEGMELLWGGAAGETGTGGRAPGG